MTTINLQVDRSLDDQYVERGIVGEYNPVSNFVSFGTRSFSSGRRRDTWVLFRGVQIPVSATITSAKLTFTGQNGETSSVESLISGNDEDEAVNPIDLTTFDAKVLTTANVTWDFSDTWTDGLEFDTPDLAAIVQEIVDRGGWAPYNNMAFLVRDDLGTDSDQRRSPYSFEGDPTKACKLEVVFTGDDIPTGSTQILFAGNASGSVAELNNSLNSGITWVTPSTAGNGLITADGILKDLRVEVSVAPGAGTSKIFTLFINDVASALVATISDTDVKGDSGATELTVLRGDKTRLKATDSGSPAATGAVWSSKFVSGIPNESLIMGGTGNGFISSTTTQYFHLGCQSQSSTLTIMNQVIAAPGTIDNLFVESSLRLGLNDGDGVDFTVFKNGVATALSLDVTPPVNTTGGSDQANSFTVVAGDTITLEANPHGTVFSLRTCAWGVRFTADTEGESLLFGSVNDLDDTTTEFTLMNKGLLPNSSPAVSETGARGNVCTLRDWYMTLDAAPGSGKSYTFTSRNDKVDGNMVIAISGASDVSGNDLVNFDVLVQDGESSIEIVPAGTPSVTNAQWGCVQFTGAAGGIPPQFVVVATQAQQQRFL